MAAIAGTVPSSVTLGDPVPEQHKRAAGTFWPDGARMVISVSMQMEGGAQPTSGAESPMPKIDPKYPDLPASKWYDYGYKEGLPRLLEVFDRRKIKSLPIWSVQRWTCTRHSQRKSYNVGTKQPDTDPSVAGLVYVAAHMPDAGENEADDGKRFPSDLSKSTAIKKTADGFIYLDPAQFHEYFAADLSAEQAAFHGAIAGTQRGGQFQSSDHHACVEKQTKLDVGSGKR